MPAQHYQRPAPFKLTGAPVPLERDIHKACASALRKLLAPPARWACYPAGALQLSAQQMARYSELGLQRGWPDLMISYQGMWGIELKRPGGALSKTYLGKTRSGVPKIFEGQDEVFPALIASGGFRDIAICHSVTQMLEQLEAWQIPLRGRIAA